MGVEVSRLANGITVVTDTMATIESVALGIWIKSGARDERDDEHGIAHLLEHMAFKGTGSRSAMESFKAFRGCEPKVDALLNHLGLTNQA